MPDVINTEPATITPFGSVAGVWAIALFCLVTAMSKAKELTMRLMPTAMLKNFFEVSINVVFAKQGNTIDRKNYIVFKENLR